MPITKKKNFMQANNYMLFNNLLSLLLHIFMHQKRMNKQLKLFSYFILINLDQRLAKLVVMLLESIIYN